MSVQPCRLPEAALLARYSPQQMPGAYTDCFAVDVIGLVSHAQFVEAFYTSWLFKIERAILRVAVGRPSTDVQAGRLAAGLLDRFAAWEIEDRAPNQVLLTDWLGRTRSWLMVVPQAAPDGGRPVSTRLFFGSAVVPVHRPSARPRTLGFLFHAMLGFHQAYSRLLLRAAAKNLMSINRI